MYHIKQTAQSRNVNIMENSNITYITLIS